MAAGKRPSAFAPIIAPWKLWLVLSVFVLAAVGVIIVMVLLSDTQGAIPSSSSRARLTGTDLQPPSAERDPVSTPPLQRLPPPPAFLQDRLGGGAEQVYQPPPIVLLMPQTISVDRNSGPPSTFPQVGYVQAADNRVFPLFGRPSVVRRTRFQYYCVLPDQGIKVPIVFKGKDCLGEVACDELYNGDVVELLGEQFTVRMYERNFLV
jgi:hypothetical protein